MCVFTQLRETRGLPDMLRVDNGAGASLGICRLCAQSKVCLSITSSQANRIFNAFIERFNRTYREEVLNMYLFSERDEVREITRR